MYYPKYYPKELFSINETLTMLNLAEYDRKRENWYKAAEELFPDYFKMGLRERLEKQEIINSYVGYRI